MKFTNALSVCNSLWTALVPRIGRFGSEQWGFMSRTPTKKMGFSVESAKSETGRGSNRIV